MRRMESLCLGDLSGDSVHITLAVLAQLSALLGFLNQLHLLELLESVSGDMAVTLSGVAGSAASVDGATVHDGESTDSYGALDVELSCDGSSSDIGGEF